MGRRSKQPVHIPLRLHPGRAEVPLAAQREDALGELRRPLRGGQLARPSALREKPGLTVGLEAAVPLRSVGREMPQRRQVDPASPVSR